MFRSELPQLSPNSKMLKNADYFCGSNAPDDVAGHCAEGCTPCLCTPGSRTDETRRPDERRSLRRLQHLQRCLRQLQAVHPLVHSTSTGLRKAQAAASSPRKVLSCMQTPRLSCRKPTKHKIFTTFYFSLSHNSFQIYIAVNHFLSTQQGLPLKLWWTAKANFGINRESKIFFTCLFPRPVFFWFFLWCGFPPGPRNAALAKIRTAGEKIIWLTAAAATCKNTFALFLLQSLLKLFKKKVLKGLKKKTCQWIRTVEEHLSVWQLEPAQLENNSGQF